ncbi:MAG: CAP domain-containing protein [Chlorobiaceae bacterium]|nr:CAP domain-containing protein [Chlorobiaceae bacterium]
MRTIQPRFSLLLLFLSLLPSPPADARLLRRPDNSSHSIETSVDAGYSNARDRAVIEEINLMRRDPAMYVRKYLKPLRAYYQGGLLRYPGSIPMRTSEGVAALDECIRELEAVRPLPLLSPSRGLMLAARDHVQDQGPAGAFGHTGSDGSSLTSRIERYGQWGVSAGENISYGYGEPRKIVAALLIDDGVSSRGHRKNLLNGSFRVVGVQVGPHRVYRNMCVMDFAGGYQSR